MGCRIVTLFTSLQLLLIIEQTPQKAKFGYFFQTLARLLDVAFVIPLRPAQCSRSVLW